MDNKLNKNQISNSDALSQNSVLNENHDIPGNPKEPAIKSWNSFFLEGESASSDFFSDRLPDDK